MEDTTTTAPAGPITTYSQDQAAARLAEIGQSIGAQLRYVPQRKIRRVPNPAADPNNPNYVFGSPPTIDTEYTVETWYDPRTNTPIFAGERQPDGSFSVTLDTTPRQTQAAGYGTSTNIEGTPTGRKNPDGTPEYDNSRPIKVTRSIANPSQIVKTDPLTGPEREQWEKDKNRNAGLGPYTDAEVQQRQQTTSAEEPVEGYPGWRVRKTVQNGQTKTVYINPQGQEAADPHPPARNPNQTAPTQAADGSWGYWDSSSGKPVWTPIANGPAGKKYTDVKFDEQRGQWWGFTQAGQWEQIAGGPGARTGPQKPGPAMPTFVVGMATDALRVYGDQLAAAVANGDMTPAERDKRWNEALQAAQQATNEATVIQRQQESNLNARVNLATTRYTQQMDGLNNALSFVTKLNGTLPEGSDLGAKAFAALIGMQAIAAKRSGIYDINPPSTDMTSAQGQQIRNATATATGETSSAISRLTNPADPAAVHADQQAVSAQLQQAGAEAERQRVAAEQRATAPSAPAQGSARPSAVAPVASATAASAPAAPSPAPAPTSPGLVVNPATTFVPSESEQRNPDTWTGAPMFTPESGTAPPYNADPSQGPVGQAPPGDDFAIMQTINRPQPPSFVMTPTDMSDHPAILMDRAQTTPPWRLDPSEIERMRAAGIPDATIFAVPGVAA